MGQRHQVYVFINALNAVKDDSGQVPDTEAIAYHNQWCYGTLPLRHLNRIVQFQEKANKDYGRIGQKYYGAKEADKVHAILSCDPQEGFYDIYTDITSEVETKWGLDPTRGDNNDGITVIAIDANRKEVAYCFMSIGDGDSTILNAPGKIPLSAREYVELYYPQQLKWKELRIVELLKSIETHARLLSLDEYFRLLPAFYKPEEKEIKAILKDPGKWVGAKLTSVGSYVLERALKNPGKTLDYYLQAA